MFLKIVFVKMEMINWSLPFLPSSIAEMRADAKPGPLEDAARSVIDKINL